MLEIVYDFENISGSNLAVLLQKEDDIALQLWVYELESAILQKIQTLFTKQENTCVKFFVGREDFEEIIVFFYPDKTQNIQVFLGEHIGQIPEKFCFVYNKDNILLDGIILGKYKFENYLEKKQELEIFIKVEESYDENLLWQRLATLSNITAARDLVNTPSNDKTPEKYLKHIKEIKWRNTRIKVLDYEDIKREKLGLLEAVGRASTSKPKLVILEHIVDKKLPYIGFVGKGITFDTGGLNIKVENHMMDMKMDMAGSATLLYMMKEIDEKDIWVNVITALCLAENSIAWDAYRPGDILTSYSGKTVEITNTDAEGRLVLADGISYLSKNYTLESITTTATLTGACMVALGYHYAGIMGNNRQFIDILLHNPTFEKYWELPQDDYLSKKTKGKISDYINYTSGVMAGSSMGGAFLKEFCLNKELFTHIDLAGPAMISEKFGVYNVGATGFGVESLSYVVENLGKE